MEEKRQQWHAEAADRGRAAESPNAEAFVGLLKLGRGDDAAAFNAAVADYMANHLNHVSASDKARSHAEAVVNLFDPFYWCAGLYVLVGVLTAGAWMAWAAPNLRRGLWLSALLLAAATLTVHTTGLFTRMYLMDRPLVFVTNLYSSAVFIGWGAAVLGLMLEVFSRRGFGLAVISVVGFGTMFIARYLSATGDTLEMLQAVLDTNLWLASHVTTVTLGYMATFVAGFIGVLWVQLSAGRTVWNCLHTPGGPTLPELCASSRPSSAPGRWWRSRPRPWSTARGNLTDASETYTEAVATGAAAAAAPAALGLVLARPGEVRRGGRWRTGSPAPAKADVDGPDRRTGSAGEDRSTASSASPRSSASSAPCSAASGRTSRWGRFWGWDPKENGAVLIVIWNALILHARWCGLVKDRGAWRCWPWSGNMVTAWSWFGTNQLGIGLHAYGFNNRLADGCTLLLAEPAR